MNVDALMDRALALAARARGCTSPNPMVGALVVRDGRVVGEGFHHQAGQPHAEPNAIAMAGDCRNATLFVTLEPCAHTGRTPPCSDAVIRAGFKRVVVAQLDPNPQVAGRGRDALTAAGIAVDVGVREAEARELNAFFNTWIVRRRPFLTLKLATSLDGRIAAGNGRSQWITGSTARSRVHALRAEHDAVMVGGGTARADNPRLTPRGLVRHELPPLTPTDRVVVASRFQLSAEANVLKAAEGAGRTFIVGATEPPASLLKALEPTGGDAWNLPAQGGSLEVDLRATLDRLGRLPNPVTSVLVEGGGQLAGSLLRQGLVDRLILHQAPVIIGADGLPAFGPLGLDAPADGPRLDIVSTRRLGADLEIVAVPDTSLAADEEAPCSLV